MADVASTASRRGSEPKAESNILRIPARRDVENILQSFNTWAYKREQPSDTVLLAKFVERAVLRRDPVSFVLYWGKGPRSTVESYELRCLEYLASMAARLKAAYGPGAAVKLVLTDTHARHNGHPAADMNRYFDEVADAARDQGFSCYLLGDLCDAAAPHVPVTEFAEPSAETLATLARSAMRWYRGGGTAEEGALYYYRMNMFERDVIEHFFPSSVFVTFNGREHRDLFPRRLPIFYMYSMKRGTSVKPWFLPDPSTPDVALAG